MRMLAIGLLFLGSTRVGAAEPPPALKWYDGNTLYELCEAYPARCAVYVSGVLDGLSLRRRDHNEPGPLALCLSADMTAHQVVEIVTAYLRNHPKERDQAASWLIWTALYPHWECQ